MGLNTKTIKRRIKSIGSTKKITKAMEMISAVKMRRAVNNALATRNYSELASAMLKEVALSTNINLHPLLAKRPIKKIGLVLITGNRGLAGGFGSKILQATHNFITAQGAAGAEVDIFLTGRQGKKIYYKFGHKVVAEFDKIDLTTKIEEILPLIKTATDDFVRGKYDAIAIAYTNFVSALTQTPVIKQILPIINDTEFAGNATESESKFLFEPKTEEVLNVLLPRLVEMQIYQSLLESDASEHSARMLAMRNASDAADEMIKDLNYTFNKARQAAITQEISEIVGGSAALE